MEVNEEDGLYDQGDDLNEPEENSGARNYSLDALEEQVREFLREQESSKQDNQDGDN